jgi:hypothetical protein
MHKFTQPVAIFGFLYLGSCLVAQLGLPELIAWNFAHCSEPSLACSVSATLLSYWWLALLPLIAIATLLINWLLATRHAA